MARHRKLADEAKRLYVAPDADIVSTRYPTLATLTDAEGVKLDAWQEGVAKLILARNKDGKYAFGSGGVGMSLPRQVGKTWLVSRLVFAMSITRANQTIIWTAHHTRTSDETFDHMRSMAQKYPYKRYIKLVRAANGQQTISFNNGSRIMFGSRERGFGRGFDAVDAIILDEAQILSARTLSDLLPTMNASPDPIYIMMGTPPRPMDPSEAFSSRRERAWNETAHKALWVEFGANRTDNPAAKSTWRKANPTLGRRTDLSAIERLQELPDADFKREALGIWDDNTGGEIKLAISNEDWDACIIDRPPTEQPIVTCVGIDMTPDRSTLVVSRARRYESGRVLIDLYEAHDVRADGTQWAIDLVAEHWRTDWAAVMIDAKSPAATLIEDFPKSIKVTKTQYSDIGMATGRLLDLAQTHVLAVPPKDAGQDLLHQAQQCATLRVMGKAGLTALQSAGVGEVIAPLVAASLAIHGCWTTRRRPGHKQILR